jgi:hypothetical protein
MWLKAEIAKCPVCSRYHDLNIKDAKFLYNVSKCDECIEQAKNNKKIIKEIWHGN